ncbi:MAG: hypothetical protein QOH87_256 [Trebonia sp.]|nr:hypothetical protein [Trebonia sp.]
MTSAQLPIPEARYARGGDFSITYQVMGEGPIEAYVWRADTDGGFSRETLAAYLAFIQQ